MTLDGASKKKAIMSQSTTCIFCICTCFWHGISESEVLGVAYFCEQQARGLGAQGWGGLAFSEALEECSTRLIFWRCI